MFTLRLKINVGISRWFRLRVEIWRGVKSINIEDLKFSVTFQMSSQLHYLDLSDEGDATCDSGLLILLHVIVYNFHSQLFGYFF